MSSPHEQEIDLSIADDDDDERDEEDLAVKAGVIEVSPLVRGEASKSENSRVTRPWVRGGDTRPEVVGCALVEILYRVLHHPEDDGLGGGEEDGQHPG